MEIIAQTKHLRISARKVRYVVDAIRHLLRFCLRFLNGPLSRF